MSKLNALLEWLDEKKYKADIVDVILKARELRDAEPPYDREEFRRELIVSLSGNPMLYCKDWKDEARNREITKQTVFDQADAIITEYERRRGNDKG